MHIDFLCSIEPYKNKLIHIEILHVETIAGFDEWHPIIETQQSGKHGTLVGEE